MGRSLAMPERRAIDSSKLSSEDREGLARSTALLKERLSPEDRERLAELIARFKERFRELGLDRRMTTRELLAKNPAIAAGNPAFVDFADEQADVDEAEVDRIPG
jgi:hypothetical protein